MTALAQRCYPVPVAETLTREDEKTTQRTTLATGWKTILFNCDCHSFDEVERQLVKAIRCDTERSKHIAWQVHTQGSAVVYEGPRERCEAVAAVLEDIRLVVQVCP